MVFLKNISVCYWYVLFVQDDDLRQTIAEGWQIEQYYGHYFDKVVVNTDINQTYQEILKEVTRIETVPQWVPATWVRNS